MIKPHIRREAVAISALNAFAYGLASLYNNFSQIYIRGHHDTAVTGLLLSIGPAVAMLAPFLWGVLADRARSRKSMLLLMVAGSAIGFMMLGFSKSFAAMAVSLLVFMFFYSPLTGLNDLISVEGCALSGVDYGQCRVFGTLFYGLLPLFIAPLTSANINYIFVAYGLIVVLCAASTLSVPEQPAAAAPKPAESDNKSGGGVRGGFFAVMLRDRKLMMLLIIYFVAQFSFGSVLIYYPEYLTGTLGFSQSVWAALIMATVVGEIPLFLFYNKIVDRLGINKMIVLGVALCTLRMASYMVFRSVLPIIVFSAITGFGITLLSYSILIYVTRGYARNRRSTVMNFVYCLAIYAARMLAGVAAGAFVEKFGVPALMLAASVMSASSFAFYFVYRAGGPTSPRNSGDSVA